MRERAQYALALVLELVASGGALLIAGRHWQSVLVHRPRPFHDYLLEVSGRTVDAAPTALALVGLAGIVAVLATRGWPRRVVGGIVALAGAGLVWQSLAGLAAIGPARARALVQDQHAEVQLGTAVPQTSVHEGWVVLSCLCGVLLLVAGALIAWRGHRWRTMSAKYDGPTARERSAEDRERERQRADASLWSALDRGDDPTQPGPGADGTTG